MSIQAILFDLDNTLTNRSQSISAYAQFLIQFYSEKLIKNQLGLVLEIIHRIDNGGYPKKEILTYSSIGASVAHALLQELEWLTSPDFNELTSFWFEKFGKNAVIMDGAEQLLKQLKQQKYKLAVVSNGGHATRLAILDGLGLNQYFDAIISSELVGISKPNPEIFIEASTRLNVDVKQCLFVGDHPINDVYGAQNVGMKAVFMEGFHSTDQIIDNRIQHLSELWKFL